MITNDSATNTSLPAEKRRTFMYEYMGKDFTLDLIDDIMTNRLQKNRDENKFIYLMQTYRRLENHLYTKSTISTPLISPEQLSEIKDQLVGYFNSCLQVPEMFNIDNDKVEQVLDNDGAGMMGQQEMLMAMLGGGGMGMGQAFTEKLCSNRVFNFTLMQNQLWEAFEKEAFGLHQEFMRQLINVVKDDEDQASLLFTTLFDKMHLSLNSIKIEKFRLAEAHLETLKTLLDHKEAQSVFVSSSTFLSPHLNGKQVQMETYLGRYLSFSCLAQETKGFKDQYFRGGLAKQSLSGLNRLTDTVAEQLHSMHKSVQEVIAKLLKNREVKDRVIDWLRRAVSLNMEKQKMFTQMPVASDGFIYNLIDVMLLFCKPFTAKFSEYHQHFPKINCFYLLNDAFIAGGSKIEKLDSEALSTSLTPHADLHSLPFTHLTAPLQETSSLMLSTEEGGHGNGSWQVPPPNFISEVWFMAHILINMVAGKLEKQYEHLAKMINEAAHKKDLASFEEYMG